MKKLLSIIFLFLSITLFAQESEIDNTLNSDSSISQKDFIIDALISYLNQQDWSYLRAKKDWGWYGKLVIHFNRHGISNKVKYKINTGFVHENDLKLPTKRKLVRQVKKTLLKRDLSDLNPQSRYEIKVMLDYSTDKKELVWSLY